MCLSRLERSRCLRHVETSPASIEMTHASLLKKADLCRTLRSHFSCIGFGFLDAATTSSAQRWFGEASYGGFVYPPPATHTRCVWKVSGTRSMSKPRRLTLKRHRVTLKKVNLLVMCDRFLETPDMVRRRRDDVVSWTSSHRLLRRRFAHQRVCLHTQW